IESGHIYVARPPLYKVTQKKQIRYVQTVEEMSTELMARGLAGTRLEVAATQDGQAAALFEGVPLEQLLKVLGELEESLVILERRGANPCVFFAPPGPARRPAYRVPLWGPRPA